MPRPVIEIQGLGKRYRIRGQREPYLSLRDELAKPFRRLMTKDQKTRDQGRKVDFWALRDISFSVNEGEAVGIIGCNGAGKSTLLKVLSKITPPTEGGITTCGRVASLLEVGTGFHPELTGRENIYLNGAILGMTRAEVKRKFDEIVTFAEIERFLNTPVKRYSSGMYVRLAFAVAAHLEPEILLVDEVLAVGDAEFQKRCLGKMDEVARGGRTILFVSHNMGAIQRLCPSTIWIDGGRIRAAGMTSGIVGAYLKAGHLGRGTAEMVFPEMPAKGAQLRKARVLSQNGSVRQLLSCDEPIVLDLLFHVNVRIPGLYGYMEISRGDGTRLLVSYSHDHMPDPLDGLTPGMYSFRVTIPPRVLGPGAYTVYLSFTSRQSMHFEVDSPGVVCGFAVQDSMTKSGNNRPGMLSVLLPWDVKEVSEEAAA